MTLRRIAILLCPVVFAPWLASQCPVQVEASFRQPGEEGGAAVTTWDPDGAGPQPLQLVLAGAIQSGSLKLFDPASGQLTDVPIGAPTYISSLAVVGGDLIVAGQFTSVGGVPASNIARYDGSSWSTLGAGISGSVDALLPLPNGDLVAGGGFTMAGGAPANFVARWDGAAWSPLGAGANQRVQSLALLPNGDIVAGGGFTSVGGVTTTGIASWNGTSWSSLGGGMNYGSVRRLQVLPNGDLVAVGNFTMAGGIIAYGFAIWNGSSWSGPIPTAGVPIINDITILPNGDLLVAGQSGTAWRFDGATWSPFGSSFEAGNGYSMPYLFAIEATPFGVVTFGQFQRIAGRDALGMAVHDGVDWRPLVSGLLGPVAAIARGANRMLIGGAFVDVDGVPINGIAAYDGTSWSALGGGVSGGPLGVFGYVRTIVEMQNGDVYAGGTFTTAGGVAAAGIARWDGTNWSALGGGLVPAGSGLPVVNDILALPNGDLIVGGSFVAAAGGPQLDNIARWNGTSWSAVGPGLPAAAVIVLDRLPNGDLIVGGSFPNSMGLAIEGLRIWNGSVYSVPGGGVSAMFSNDVYINELLVLPNGDVVVAGQFDFAGGVPTTNLARWDGSSWSAFDAGLTIVAPRALHRLPDGDLLAAGWFEIAGQSTTVARWQGAAWSVVPGIEGGFAATLAADDSGRVFVGGSFPIEGRLASLAILASSCPATATPSGVGCTGSGGANVLTATSLPWIGGTFASQATGMPANGLALGVRGLGTLTTPLATILPQGQTGCDLLVTAELLDLYVPASGIVATSLAIPNTITLAGQVLHQQIVPVELDPQGNITSLTSTNRLTLTIGSF